ncbi:DMT family transporter [Ramlibacter sp. AW1]|uniref:DMT family transporter n=1 Tax=Ramlibacter aurantiacus TaxID=2801330 RepID=A0A937D8D1_9BURK|nr:DMT family transporter [Ramlibacter aurantiacus]
MLAGIALLMLACLFFASNDTAGKVLVVSGVPVVMAIWGRYVAQAVAISAVALPLRGRTLLRTRQPGFHLLRGLMLLGGSVFVFWSLLYMPVGELTAIIMITPLLVTLLGATVLKERVSPLRWLLVAGGFAGTLVIIRPGGSAFGWVMVLPLLQVAFSCGFQLLTSRMARTEDPFTMHFYTSWVGVLATSLAVPLAWAPLASPWLWLLMAGMGALSTVGHLLFIGAFQRAPASTLMPYVYVQIGFAMLAGWLVFGHVPDGWSMLGMALIAACGMTGAWLSVQEMRARLAPVPARQA